LVVRINTTIFVISKSKNMSTKLANIGNYGLHVIQVPSGKFSYVGSIPRELMIVTIDSFGIERYKTPVFETEKAAIDYYNNKFGGIN
jgi:hypothetical protein